MSHETMALLIFILVMTLIISEKIHRTAAAVLGAVLLFFLGILDVETAMKHIDFNTVGVLVGMMIFISVIKHCGIFAYLAVKAARFSRGDPRRLMAALMVITALLSSILDNVTTVMLIGPVTFSITRTMGVDPVPYMIAQIMASNIGGTATLIGDPPNIMLGSAADISFMEFLSHNGPVVMIILMVTVVCFHFLYRKQMQVSRSAMHKVMEINAEGVITDWTLLKKSIIMILVTVAGFGCSDRMGIETSIIALTAAAVMLATGKQDVKKTVVDVEWATILFFIGLFIVAGGLIETGVVTDMTHIIMAFTHGHEMLTMLVILWASALLSSILDNIPFITAMIPLISSLGAEGMDPMPLWWALSLGACLGGNGTLIGASANVVLAGVSEKYGYPISYMRYLKTGFPLMLFSVVICSGYLLLVHGA